MADTSGTGADPEQARLMYYGHDGRLLQEWVDDDLDFADWSAGSWKLSDTDRTQQYVWGLRYLDDIVLHRADRNKDGDYVDAGDGAWHHLTDAQYSSVCLVDGAAAVVERVTYSAYGIARHHWATDVDGDGAVTTGAGSDFSLVSTIASDTLANRTIGGSAYRSEADLDRSGVIDATDRGLVGSARAALALGQLGAMGNAAPDTIVGWDGYLFNAESALYTVRFRSYLPALGRWAERDPAGYVDGVSLYQYLRSDPCLSIDPLGLAEVCGPRVWLYTGWWCVEEEVWDAAYQQVGETAHDNLQGYGDAVGVDDLLRTGHTFDPRERARGKCYATCIGLGILDRILLQNLKSGVLEGIGGIPGIGVDAVTNISFCDTPELRGIDWTDLTSLPDILERLGDSFQRYLQRKLDDGFEKEIRRRDPFRAPGKSLKQAQREARENYKRLIEEVGSTKAKLAELGTLLEKLMTAYEMAKLIADCYQGCDKDPCADPCTILRESK